MSQKRPTIGGLMIWVFVIAVYLAVLQVASRLLAAVAVVLLMAFAFLFILIPIRIYRNQWTKLDPEIRQFDPEHPGRRGRSPGACVP